jgi:hypothetical protein
MEVKTDFIVINEKTLMAESGVPHGIEDRGITSYEINGIIALTPRSLPSGSLISTR